VQVGVAKLVGTSRERIVVEVSRLLTDPVAHAAMARETNPYGDGHAAHRIVATLMDRSEHIPMREPAAPVRKRTAIGPTRNPTFLDAP
jgi:UDP-N-acetylglucosamine 2-epimerase (non-hydrolysing)